MAIIACTECDHKVSDRASNCPNCGAPVAGGTDGSGVRPLLGVLAGVVILGLIAITIWPGTRGRSTRTVAIAHPAPRPAEHFPTTKQTPPDESKGSLTVYQTTADQLYQDYNTNGVATQTRIGRGRVRVSGTIAAIEEDAAGHPVVKLWANRANSAELTLTDDQTAAASQLRKGQSVDVQCASMHGINGLPVGSECILAVVTATSVAMGQDAGASAEAGAASPAAAAARPAEKSPRARSRPARAHDTRAEMVPVEDSVTANPAPVQPVTAAVPEPIPVDTAPEASPVNGAVTTAAVQASAPVVASDDLATVRQTDPAAADHIAAYCANSIAAANGASFAAGCRRDEKEAWTRLVLNHEFPALDDDTRRKCSEPPFPDTYTAKESCARYQLSKTSASAQ